MTTVRSTLTAALACIAPTLCLPSNAAGDDLPPISDLVPAHTLVVVEIDDLSALRSTMEDSALWQLATSPEMERFVEAVAQGSDEADQIAWQQIARRIGIDPDELDWPTGRVGLAIAQDAPAADLYDNIDPDESDPLTGSIIDPPGLLVIADLGNSADAIDDALDTLIDFGLDKGYIELDERPAPGDRSIVVLHSAIAADRQDRTQAIWSEYQTKLEALDRDSFDEAWAELWQWYSSAMEQVNEPTGDPVEDAIADLFASTQDLAYARFDDQIVMGLSEQMVLDALIALDDGLDAPATNAPFIARTSPLLSETTHARAFVNLAELTELSVQQFAAFARSMDTDSAAMTSPMAMTGLMDFQGLGVGLTLDDDSSVVQLDAAALVDDKRGLLALIDLTDEPLDPPAFVPSDAIVAARLLVDCPHILDEVQRMVEQLPDDQRDQVLAQVQLARGVAGPILNNLGPEVYLWAIPNRAANADDAWIGSTLLAVRTRDAQALAGSIAGLTAMAGLEGRQFEGAQLYAAPDGTLAVGLSDEWAIVCTGVEPVEDALRRIADPAGDELSTSPAFQQAVVNLDTTGPVTGVLSTEQTLTLISNAMTHNSVAGADEFPPIDLWLDAVGDLSFAITSIDEGFIIRVRINEPADDR